MNVTNGSTRDSQAEKKIGSRDIGPDLIRSVAAIMVVYLHACVPYLKHPMPNLVWPVTDEASNVCDQLFWAIEIVVMPLFLVISGFYAYRAFADSDGASFLKSRTKRLLRPLLFGAVVILPIDLYIWMAGFVSEGHLAPVKLRSLKVPSPLGDHLWGMGHLWFLMYVFLYGAIMVAASRWVTGGLPMRLRPAIRRGSAIVISAIGIITLTFSPEVVFGFQHSFLPVISKWIYSGSFFAGGVALAVFDPHFRTIDRLAWRNFSVGSIATAAALIMGAWSLREHSNDTLEANSSWLVAISLASITVVAAWMVALGSIGLANCQSDRLAHYPRVCEMIRYFAGASFWIYLVHHPIVGLAHIDLKWLSLGLSPFVKSLVTLGIALGWGLLSYEIFIRNTAFGEFLGLVTRRDSVKSAEPAIESEFAAPGRKERAA